MIFRLILGRGAVSVSEVAPRLMLGLEEDQSKPEPSRLGDPAPDGEPLKGNGGGGSSSSSTRKARWDCSVLDRDRVGGVGRPPLIAFAGQFLFSWIRTSRDRSWKFSSASRKAYSPLRLSCSASIMSCIRRYTSSVDSSYLAFWDRRSSSAL